MPCGGETALRGRRLPSSFHPPRDRISPPGEAERRAPSPYFGRQPNSCGRGTFQTPAATADLAKARLFHVRPQHAAPRQRCHNRRPGTGSSARVARPKRSAPLSGRLIRIRLGAPASERKCQLASQSARADCRKLWTLPRESGEDVYGLLIRARFATVAAAIPNTTTAHEDAPG